MNDQGVERSGSVGRIDPDAPEAPSRVISRAGCGFSLDISAEGIRAFGRLPPPIFLTAIVAANVQHIDRSAVHYWRYGKLDQIAPDNDRRPVSVLGLAQSLQMPFETTRENVNALIREGLVIKTKGGVIVPLEVIQSEAMATLENRSWEIFCDMIAKLKALGFDFSVVLGESAASSALFLAEDFKPASNRQGLRRLISRVISEFYLRIAVEGNAAHGDDWVTGQVSIGFILLNSAAWRLNREEAWLYARADSRMPEALQVPASVTEVARVTGLGERLVRRKAKQLVATGRLTHSGRGFLVSIDYMNGPQIKTGATAIVSAFYRMIYDLNALGVRL
jgi:hypothetical protein